MSSSSFEMVRSYEEIVRKLNDDLKYHKNNLELLEKIEIKRKKDGTHFQNKNQTFVNGKIVIKAYNDYNHPTFQVSGYTSDGKFNTYEFDAYMYVDDMKAKNPEDERVKDLKNSDGFWRTTYLLNTDEIIEKIESEKENQKKYIENYEKQISASKQAFNEVAEKLDLVKLAIIRNCKELRDNPVFRCSLEYALINYVRTDIS